MSEEDHAYLMKEARMVSIGWNPPTKNRSPQHIDALREAYANGYRFAAMMRCRVAPDGFRCGNHHYLPAKYWGEECPWCLLYDAVSSQKSGLSVRVQAAMAEVRHVIGEDNDEITEETKPE
jgi:hypothetical protein